MELESDLAKELFNKVIVPLQTKNKQKEITVQNEYERTQEQLQDTRNKQQELDKLRVQGAKAIADEKANRLAQEAEAARVAREEADRMAKEEAARLAQEAETERVAREKAEADKKAQEEAARRAQIEVEKQAIEQGDRLITPIKAAEEGKYRMKQREFKRIAPIEAATKGAERMAKEVNIPPPPPSPETITTDLGESIQNKFDVNPLLQTLTNTLNKDLSLDTEISPPPPPPVPMFNVNQLIHILNKSLAMPAPVAPSTAVVPAPVIPVVPAPAPSTVPTPTAVVPSTAPSTSVVAPTAVVPAPAPPSTAVVPAPIILPAQEPVTLPVAPSTPPVILPVAPSTPPVILPVAPSTPPVILPAQVPAQVPEPVPEPEVVPEPAQVVVPAIQQQPSTITPASPPEPVASIISSIDWKGNLDWLKQSVGLLIGSLSNMFTFKAAEDNDPYKLSTSKVNEGYIYIGKMYMKNDDETLPSKQVKYVNYHPEKKEFYIDEKPEVVN